MKLFLVFYFKNFNWKNSFCEIKECASVLLLIFGVEQRIDESDIWTNNLRIKVPAL